MSDTAIYFTGIAASFKPGFAVLCGHLVSQRDDPTFTRFAQVRGDHEWVHIGDAEDDIVYGLTSRPSHTVQGGTDYIALGRAGLLRFMPSRQADRDLIVPTKDRYTYLEGLCVATDGIYICGGQNQIYRFENDQWSSVDDGLYEPFNGKLGHALFSIAETTAGKLLAVGTKGLVVESLSDGRWEHLEVSTNVDLHCVLPDGNGGAWIGGDAGTLLHMLPDGQGFRDHTDVDVSTESFDSLVQFKGELYITAMDQLLVLNSKGQLKPVKGSFKKDSEFHCVSAAGDYMWVTGDENVYRLGPQGWRHLLCPDNE